MAPASPPVKKLPDPELLDPNEAAALASTSGRHLKDLVREGKLLARVMLGRYSDEIRGWIAAGRPPINGCVQWRPACRRNAHR
jgi:hypothetical protein